jgi:phosphatidylinositol-3,4,5-trisphosphate 3-phosphatase and dual-specificity protein phosphatase PTEN
MAFFIMDFLRELVGGPKKRFKEFGYNLDLTYITRRVIAMAFPASGL